MSEWINWGGDACPVFNNPMVDVRLLDGTEVRGPAATFRWKLAGVAEDIAAYRVAPASASPVASTKPQTAPSILHRAAELMEERGKQYDQPQGERSMGRAVAALNTILGRPALTESEGWLLLQLLKDVRDRQRDTPHLDSLEDGVAYAALKAESRLQEKASTK